MYYNYIDYQKHTKPYTHNMIPSTQQQQKMDEKFEKQQKFLK